MNKRFRVVKHHHAGGEGRMMTRDQEQLILIGAFGAFWLGKPFFFSNFFYMD